jgi:hypothetical protein
LDKSWPKAGTSFSTVKKNQNGRIVSDPGELLTKEYKEWLRCRCVIPDLQPLKNRRN